MLTEDDLIVFGVLADRASVTVPAYVIPKLAEAVRSLVADREQLTSDRDGYKALFERYDAQAYEDLIKARDEALAKVERLRGERDEMHRKYMQLLETWERQQPVVGAARALALEVHMAKEEDELEWDDEPFLSLMYKLIKAVDALDVSTPRQDQADEDRVKPQFGHVSQADLASIAALGRHFPNPDVSFELVDDEDPPARSETSVQPCSDVSPTVAMTAPGADSCDVVAPVRDIRCDYPVNHNPLYAHDKTWDHGSLARDAWWTGNGPRAGITDQIVLSDADYAEALKAGEIHDA